MADDISQLNLPDAVVQRYASLGVRTLFPWQLDCLRMQDVLDGRNFVYSAPTSSGKTLIAEILALKRMLEQKKKVILVLPYVSVSKEKTDYLKYLFGDLNIRVGGFMSTMVPRGGFSACDMAVCTIEKANNIVNHLAESGSLHKLGMVIIDEVHLIGDGHRGYLLELMLTKLLYNDKRFGARRGHVQVVAMSATLPNLHTIASWLDAALYTTLFRPVPLAHFVCADRNVFAVAADGPLQHVRRIDQRLMLADHQPNVVALCLETLCQGHSVLVFCPTKAACEKLAHTLADAVKMLLQQRPTALTLRADQLQTALAELKHSVAGLDKELAQVIPWAVAFHHAGLTMDERCIVESAFATCVIRVVVATTTLCSGVNLPARRVVICGSGFSQQTSLDAVSYRQMSGRAGRTGIDSEGESVVVCKGTDLDRVRRLVVDDLQPLRSCLSLPAGARAAADGPTPVELTGSMKRAILEVIASQMARTLPDLVAYMSCTLLAAQLRDAGQTVDERCVYEYVQFLVRNQFVAEQFATDDAGGREAYYEPTNLGCAVLAAGLSPDDGQLVLQDLEQARAAVVLRNELHLVYLVTPLHCQQYWQIDWKRYEDMFFALDDDSRLVGERVGVKPAFLRRSASGGAPKAGRGFQRDLNVHCRFYTALALHDLTLERPIVDVARRFATNKGTLQTLQHSAAQFAAMVAAFCQRLAWHSLHALIGDYHTRLVFGVQRELCDLLRLDTVQADVKLARMLYLEGFQTVTSVAHGNVGHLEQVVRALRPFVVDGAMAATSAGRSASCAATRQSGASVSPADTARQIVLEARRLVEQDLGGALVHWRSLSQHSSPDSSVVLSTPHSQPASFNSHTSSSPAPRTNSPPTDPPAQLVKPLCAQNPFRANKPPNPSLLSFFISEHAARKAAVDEHDNADVKGGYTALKVKEMEKISGPTTPPKKLVQRAAAEKATPGSRHSKRLANKRKKSAPRALDLSNFFPVVKLGAYGSPAPLPAALQRKQKLLNLPSPSAKPPPPDGSLLPPSRTCSPIASSRPPSLLSPDLFHRPPVDPRHNAAAAGQRQGIWRRASRRAPRYQRPPPCGFRPRQRPARPRHSTLRHLRPATR